MKYQAVRGTHDILPADSVHFQAVEATARRLFLQFGYHEIRTPTFESLDLFHRSIGEATDIVEKEMYSFEDRGGRKLALRPEGTAGVVRAFVEHHLSQSAPFCKLFYIEQMFRAERPQAGRYREFWQIGAEYFGNAAPEADAEMLLLVLTLFRELSIPNVALKINSLGDEKCRPAYLKALKDFVKERADEFCDDCKRRMDKNILRVLDCKIDGPKFMGEWPSINKFWCEDCKPHFETVQKLLAAAGAKYTLAPHLVRGLDYYTRTVFEVTTTALGAQDALAAGGRYDRLVKQLDGPDTPALGFALGTERTIEAMKALSPAAAANGAVSIFVAALGDEAAPVAFQLLQELRTNAQLRNHGILFEGGFFKKKLGAQLTIADRIGATHCLILGEEELQKGEVTLRSLKESAQQRLPRAELIAHLLKLHRA